MARSFSNTGAQRATDATYVQPTACSVLAWVRSPGAATAPRVVDIASTMFVYFDDTNKYLLFGRWFTAYGEWRTPALGTPYTGGGWFHVAVCHGGTTAAPTLYLNGVSQTVTQTSAPSGTITTTSGTLYIGNNSGTSRALEGDLADVAIHNVQLTAGEVVQHMTTGFVARGLYRLWPMVGASPEPDQSGNRANATLTGSPPVAAGEPPRLPLGLISPTWTAAPLATGVTPPTFVGAGTAAFTATTNATVTPGLPSGWAADDIHVLVAAGSNNLDWPEPDGWTKISPSAAAEDNTTAQRVEVWVRRAVGGDTAPVLSTYSGTTVRGAQIYGVRGCPTSGNAEDQIVAMSRSNNAASDVVTFATVTPGDDATRLLAVFAYEDDPTAASTMTDWTAFTTDAAQRTTSGTDMLLSYATRTWADGASATGALTTTVSGGAFANSVNVGILLAFTSTEAAPAQTVDLVGAQPSSLAGAVVTVPGAATLPLLAARPAARAGAAAALPGAVTRDLAGARGVEQAGTLTPAATIAVPLVGADGAEAAGAAATVPGAGALALAGARGGEQAGALQAAFGAGLSAELRGAVAGGRDGATALVPGAATIALSGALSGGRAGAHTITPGAVTAALLGALSATRAGAGALVIGAATIPLVGAVAGGRAGRLALAPGAVALILAGARTVDRAGALQAASGAALVSLVGTLPFGPVSAGASYGLASYGVDSFGGSGGLTLVPGEATVVLIGARGDGRAGALALATVPAQAISLLGAGPAARAGAASLTPGVALVSVVGTLASGRAGALALAPGAVTLALAEARGDGRVGTLQALPGAQSVALAGERPVGRAGVLALVSGAATVALVGAVLGGRDGALALLPGAVTLALAGARGDGRVGTLEALPGAQSVPLRGAGPAGRAGAVSLTVGVALLPLVGALASGRAGLLSLAPGAVTRSLVGARGESRAGTLNAADIVGLVELVGASPAGRDGALLVVAGATAVLLLEMQPTGRAGTLDLIPNALIIPYAATHLPTRGATSGERTGATTAGGRTGGRTIGERTGARTT